MTVELSPNELATILDVLMSTPTKNLKSASVLLAIALKLRKELPGELAAAIEKPEAPTT